MKKYYIANQNGEIETHNFENDDEAFDYAVKKNKSDFQNWKAYKENGDIVFKVAYIK